jgi:hypothetical protein
VVTYEVIGSALAHDFQDPLASFCVESRSADRVAVDDRTPAPGTVYYYLAAAEHACGRGPLGADSAGRPRPGRACVGRRTRKRQRGTSNRLDATCRAGSLFSRNFSASCGELAEWADRRSSLVAAAGRVSGNKRPLSVSAKPESPAATGQ